MSKFPEEKRTFETRLLFLLSIFNNPRFPITTMANCINFKLDKCFEKYIKDIHKINLNIEDDDKLKLIKYLD